MECARIKGHLSEYIDGTLDVQTRVLVEDHLSTCSDCKAELAALNALVEELGALETVTAPADFLEKIHEKIKPQSIFQRILRKLFVPFHIKIPLELAAAAAMVILVVSVLNVQQPGRQVARIPENATFDRFDQAPEADHEIPAIRERAKRSAPGFGPAMVKPSGDASVVLAEKGLTKSVPPDFERKLEPAPSAVTKIASKPAARTGSSIELALLLTTGVSGRVSEREATLQMAQPVESDWAADEAEKTDIAAFEKRSVKQQAGTVSEIQREGLKEESRSILPQTLRESALQDASKPSRAYTYREDSLSRVKHLVHSVNGRIRFVENELPQEKPPSIDAEIPFNQYELFCKELGRLGTFRNPPPGLADTDQDTIRVHITLIFSE